MRAAQDNRKKIVGDLIEALEQGTPPWNRSWSESGRACNAVSDKPYRGINSLNLEIFRMRNKLDDPRFCTFKQASDAGWTIQKGERHAAKVEFWQWTKREEQADENGVVRKVEVDLERPIVHVYPVFHASQIEGIPVLERKVHDWDPVEKAERIIGESGAKIEHGGDEAFYNVTRDYIKLPPKERFHDAHGYYSTALHELAHWTGNENRLNRPMVSFQEDSEKYAREELRAEIGSMFICAETGVQQSEEHLQNHAAYVSHFIGILKKDPNELFRASADAEKATEYVLQHERRREREQAQIQEKDQKRAEGRQPAQKEGDLVEEVRSLNLVPGQVKIYDARGKGVYAGKILHSDMERGYSVQQVGKVSLLVHKHENLSRVPEVGESIKIQYKPNERASVSSYAKEKQQELAR